MPNGSAAGASGSAGSVPLSQSRKVDPVIRQIFASQGLTQVLATRLGVQTITVLSVADCVEELLRSYECDHLQLQAREARVEQAEPPGDLGLLADSGRRRGKRGPCGRRAEFSGDRPKLV